MKLKTDKDLRCTAENKNKYKTLLLSVVIFCAFAVLAFLFPYTDDDWAWGSSIGLERLANFFDNYNGRYLGNLLVIVLTRSRLIRVMLTAVSMLLSCRICSKYISSDKWTALLIAFVLLCFMPQKMFAQAWVWASGFSNYVPPAIICTAYVVFIKNSLLKVTDGYPHCFGVVAFAAGFCGALFIENIALCNIVFGIAATVLFAIKFKKVFSPHFSFAVGAVSGAVLMFSNSAYHSVTTGSDTYRSIPDSVTAFLKFCFKNGYAICNNTVISNYVLCSTVSVLLFITAVRYLEKSENANRKRTAVLAASVNLVCAVLFVIKRILLLVNKNMTLFDSIAVQLILAVFAVVFAVSAFAVVCLCIEKKRKFSLLLPLCCVPVTSAPLLLVQPIGPRCFFVSYILTVFFALDLLDYTLSETGIERKNNKSFAVFVSAVALAQILFLTGVFAPAYSYDKKRIEFAQMQSENNESVIAVCQLPDSGYLRVSDVSSEPWATRFKLFYGLREDALIEMVPIEEFDKICNSYGTDF